MIDGSGTSDKSRLSRRDFLKLSGLGAGTLVVGAVAPKVFKFGVEQVRGIEEMLAQLTLRQEIREGAFLAETIGSPKTLPEFAAAALTSAEKLHGINKAAILVGHNQERVFKALHDQDRFYFPASTIKVVLCREAYLQGLLDNRTYLTPELAESILDKSQSYEPLIKNLPQIKSEDPLEISRVTRELIKGAGIEPLNEPGTDLIIDIKQQFNYLMQADLPPIMKQAMLQTRNKASEYYGISTVLISNSLDKLPIYFKIGLLYAPNTQQNELVNSFYMQIGDTLKCLGYAQGPDPYDVHLYMLKVGGLLATMSTRSAFH